MSAAQNPFAYILCGGQGTRLRSVIRETQKAVVEIHGQPFLALLLQELFRAGVREAVLCAGYRADQLLALREELTARSGVALEIVVEAEPLGTGGALLHALQRHAPPDRYLVANADTFLEAEAWRQLWMCSTSPSAAEATLLAVRVADRARFGSVFCDADGRVLQLFEKGVSGPGLVNGGAYAFSRTAFSGLVPRPCSLEHDLHQSHCRPQDNCRPQDPCSLEQDLLPLLIQRQSLRSVAYSGTLIDIGTPESLAAFRKKTAQKTLCPQSHDA
ncbi:MAG: NTP transferase domain-containing protein [Zoogloeaceae bacterium]|jgi:NDP-sugar pyrophosphorylase family protein|nr:NTP transferase domain-containing protein [Zoogloeaceae bacterium]